MEERGFSPLFKEGAVPFQGNSSLFREALLIFCCEMCRSRRNPRQRPQGLAQPRKPLVTLPRQGMSWVSSQLPLYVSGAKETRSAEGSVLVIPKR